MDLNNLAHEIHHNAKQKGFWDKPRSFGESLMLIVSELGEALEADRKGKIADLKAYNATLLSEDVLEEDMVFYNRTCFERFIKDTVEDEIADSLIRILDLCDAMGMDVEFHVKEKMNYNSKRPKLHGKLY